MVDGHGGVLPKSEVGSVAGALAACAAPAAPRGGRSCGRPAGRRRATRRRRPARGAPSRALGVWAPARRGSAPPGAGGCTAWRAKPWPARPGAGRRSSRASSSMLRRDAGHRRRDAGDARRQRQPRGGVGQAFGAAGDVQVAGPARSPACRRPAAARPAAAASCGRGPRRGRFPPAPARGRCGTAARTACTCSARLGLGQHHGAQGRARAAAPGRRRRPASWASLMRTTMRATVAAEARPATVGDRLSRRALGRRCDGILEVEHDGIGTAGQCLVEALGPVARHEEVAAGGLHHSPGSAWPWRPSSASLRDPAPTAARYGRRPRACRSRGTDAGRRSGRTALEAGSADLAPAARWRRSRSISSVAISGPCTIRPG